jgi:hypothetical protein
MTSFTLLAMRLRSRTAMKRRTRRIGEAQSKIARFFRLRKPWGKLPRRTVKRRLSVVRPWPVWRCRMDWRAR